MLGSPVDLALVFGIALVVFGPKKLPELGKSVGLGIANFKSAINQAPIEGQATGLNSQVQTTVVPMTLPAVPGEPEHSTDSTHKSREASIA